jgi:hypothetical protein
MSRSTCFLIQAINFRDASMYISTHFLVERLSIFAMSGRTEVDELLEAQETAR